MPFIYAGRFDVTTALGWMLAAWISAVALRDLYLKVRGKAGLSGLKKLSRSYYAMQLSHLGVAVSIVGVAMVTNFSEERDLRMAPGDTLAFEKYTFEFEGVKEVEGPNYRSDMGVLNVFKGERLYEVLHPEKRLYTARGNVMTEAAIDPGFFGDLYVALGEPLGNGAWAVRVQYKPYVRWIWLGALMMTFGGLLAATDPRYRRQRQREAVVASAVEEKQHA